MDSLEGPSRLVFSVVIPMRNERASIETCLESLAANDFPSDRFEVLVVDGMSDDGSRELAENLLAEMGNGRVIPNPKKITPVALNIGVQAARGGIVIILGAHSAVASDFLSTNLRVLRETGADCVGGRLVQVESDSLLTNVINVAQNCPFGTGGASFRYSEKPGYVNTVPFGAYRRDVFDRLGGFDESLYKGQDAEFNFRLVESGLSIYYSPEIKTRYFARSSLRRLFWQYLDMGWSKVFIFRKHPRLLKPYYFLPLLFTLGVIAVVIRLFFASPVERLVFPLVAAGYAFVSIGSGFFYARRKRVALRAWPVAALLFPLAFFLMHFSYGLGVLRGLFELAVSGIKKAKQPPRDEVV